MTTRRAAVGGGGKETDRGSWEGSPVGCSLPPPTSITFAVVGVPQTQGSKRAFVKNGKAWMVEQGGARLRTWREAIADAARGAHAGPLIDEPVSVLCAFTMLRPASHPKRRETWPIGARSGDLDKLARAVLDALTGVVLRDDAQVIDLHATKAWADPPGVRVTIRGGQQGGTADDDGS